MNGPRSRQILSALGPVLLMACGARTSLSLSEGKDGTPGVGGSPGGGDAAPATPSSGGSSSSSNGTTTSGGVPATGGDVFGAGASPSGGAPPGVGGWASGGALQGTGGAPQGAGGARSICADFGRVFQEVSCETCLAASVTETCSTAWEKIWVGECGTRSICVETHCFCTQASECPADTCECVDSCLLPGENACRTAWEALELCLADACRDCG